MPRMISLAMAVDLQAQESGEPLILLATIEHPQIEGGVVRLARNYESITSRGQEFSAYPFDAQFPEDSDESVAGQASLILDNVTRELVPWIRTITGRPTVKLEVVRASAPDVPEAEFLRFRIAETVSDALTIQASLVVRDFATEAYPKDSYSPALCPALGFAYSP